MAVDGIRIGTAPISWGVCEIPDWGEQLPADHVLDEMTELGYEGTELGPYGYLPTESVALTRLLRPRNLACMAAFCPVTLHEPALFDASVTQAETTARLLGALGASILILADGGDEFRYGLAGRVPADGSAGFTAEQWARFAHGVTCIAEYACSLGLRTVFHPEAGSYVETPDEIDYLLRLTDPLLVGLCLETGHITYGGGDAAEIAHRYGPRIWHVHAKDVDPSVLARVRTDGLDYMAAATAGIFAPLGTGCVDLPGVIAALSGHAYQGWIIVEQDVRLGNGHPPQDPRTNAALSFRALRSALNAPRPVF